MTERRQRQRRAAPRTGGDGGDDRARWLARVAYLLVLLIATLTSVELDLDPGRIGERLQGVLDPRITARDAVDGARNIVLFAGWGLVWILTAPRGRRSVAVLAATATGAAVSVSVELVQLLSATRTPSLLDVTTNTTGSFFGAVAATGLAVAVRTRRRARSYIGVPASVVAGAYGIATLGEALIPLFRKTPVPGAWGGPLHRFAVSASAFEWRTAFDLPWLDLLLFLPAGFLATLALVEEGLSYRRAALWTAGAGSAAMVAAELGHGVIGLPMSVGAALLHAAAIAAGAAIATRVIPPFTRRWRGAARVRVGLLAYGAVVLLWILRPYLPETDPGAVVAKLAADWWAPLQFLALRADLYSVMDVMTSFFLFLPLGAALAAWPLRRTGWLRGVLPALYLAAAAELLQLLVAGRTLDITDILVNGAGVAVGWAILRRAGFGTRGTLLPPG